MTEYSQQLKTLRSARIDLLAKNPFFADLVFGLSFVFREDLNPPTAATDGENIYLHPDFVLSLKPIEVVFLLAHEVLHPALFHCNRRGNRDPKLWNIACDIVVNYILVENKVGKMPQCGIYDPDLYKKGSGKVEKIYELLVEENKKRKNQGKPQIGEGKESGEGGAESSMDVVMDANDARKETIAAKWRTKLAQAIQTAKAAGKMPGGLEEFVSGLLEPKVPWQSLLRNFLLTTKGEDRTWTKPNRRYRASGIYLPGVYGEKLEELAILVDCSGSVSDTMIDQACSEIRYIQEELRPDKIHVIYFDTDVKKHEEYQPDDALTMKAYGRGGTVFSTSFKFIAENNIDPTTCVVLTDLECEDFGSQPPYPVLWVTENTKGKAPWGQIVVTK